MKFAEVRGAVGFVILDNQYVALQLERSALISSDVAGAEGTLRITSGANIMSDSFDFRRTHC
jgi:hypothetical protein